MRPNPYTPAQAVAYLTRLWHTQAAVAPGYCDRLFGRGYGWFGSGESSARVHYEDPLVTDRLPGQVGGIGSGAVWSDGPTGDWHIATIANNTRRAATAYVLTPDVVRVGRVNLVPLEYVHHRWPHMTFVGSIGAQFPRGWGSWPHSG